MCGMQEERQKEGDWERTINRKPERTMVTKAEGESSTNFVACLCHQHPVGTTDVQMMSCRKGIGWEGGATGAREDSGQAEPRSERVKGETEEGREKGLWQSFIALQSRNYSVFMRWDSKCSLCNVKQKKAFCSV